MSPQGDQIAVAYISGLVRILSLKTLLEVARLQGFEAGCYSLAFDPTGRTLAAGYENGTIKFWDVQRQVVTGTLADRRRRCLCLAYAPSGEWGISANAAGTLQIWDAATATERFSWSSQNYSFVLERAQDQNAATLSICRGQAILREQKLSLRSGITHMIARREGEQLHVQVDEHPPLVFHDYFPPRAIEKGVWGLLLLNGAKCDQLVVRRSLANNSANALQQGDEQFRLGRFAAALDAYAEQLSESATEENNRTRQEALLMSAFCFLRLNRSDDASRILKELARSKEATAPVIQAKFQLWSLLLLQGKAAEADALFQTIRLEHPLSQLSDVISADLRMDIFHIYHHSLARRRNLLQSGVVERLESLLEIAKYFELDERALDGVRWQIVSALRLVDRQEETLPHLRRLQQVNEQSLQSLTVLNTMDGLNRLKRRGFVDRALGQPTHSLASLTALFDRTRNVATAATTANNKSNVGWIEAIELELARTLAAEQRWQEVAERLQPMVDGQPQLLEVLVDSGLLLGFAHRHLGNSEQATMAWQGAANKLPANSVADADLYQDIELVPRLMWLRGLSGKLSADEFQRDLRFLQTRLASMPGTDRILDQFPLNVSMFTQCCHSQPGYANIERAACGNLTITEEVRGFLVVTAYQMIMDGAFGNAASEDQREFALQLTQSGFRAYAENQLSLPIFLQLGMAWKGVPAPLGWQFLFSGIPEPMRPGTAYLLGKRFERKQNLETAKTLWQLAKEQAAPDSLVHRLTTAEL